MKGRKTFCKNRIIIYLLVFVLCSGGIGPMGLAADLTDGVSLERENAESIQIETSQTETSQTETMIPETITPERVYTKDLPQSVNQTIKEVRSYVLSEDKNPDKDSQWYVLSCARSGLSLDKKYFKTFFRNIASYLKDKDGVITANQYSEYSKMILVLTSLGYDARDVAGYNLLSYLSDFTKVKKQGVNGPVWALLALNCHPLYEIPVNEEAEIQTTQDVLIAYLLERELEGGGWTFSGEKADTDMTAMTIQALAPYYNQIGYEEVHAAIDRGIALLSSIQNPESGGFQSGGIDNLESCAQVVVALSTLGIDCKEDPRFVKNGNWPVYDLISYQIEDSGFRHSKDGNLNKLATAQGFYALDAYKRLTKGQTALYDMSDIVIHVGEVEEIHEESSADSGSEKETKPQKETKPEKETKPQKETKPEKETRPQKETKAQKETKPKNETKPQNETRPQRETMAHGESQKETTSMQAMTKADSQSRFADAESNKAELEDELDAEEESLEYAEIEEGAWAFEGQDYVSTDSMDAGMGAETGALEETMPEARKEAPHRKTDLGILGSMAGMGCFYCIYDFRKKKRG